MITAAIAPQPLRPAPPLHSRSPAAASWPCSEALQARRASGLRASTSSGVARCAAAEPLSPAAPSCNAAAAGGTLRPRPESQRKQYDVVALSNL